MSYNSRTIQVSPAFPRAHHKFVVFCREKHETGEGWLNYTPYEVWTGSFNFTANACKSFENVIVSSDPNIVLAFFKEYAQIAALSEPLDWEVAWTEPQCRIGS